MLYSQTLGRAASFYPGHLAVVDGDRRVTYGELAARVERLAGLLVSKGFAAGDRLAFLLPNGLEFVELTFACCRLGVVAVPLNTRYAVPELEEALRDAEPRGFVRHPTLPEPNFRAEWQVVVGDPGLRKDRHTAPPDPFYDPQALFGLFYTSGTTGRAKGVMLTHANLFANMLHAQTWCPFRCPDVFLHVAPMFHLADFPVLLMSAATGVAQVTLPRFDLHLLCETIEREQVTASVMIPTMINLLTQWPQIDQFDLSSLRRLLYGGAPIAPEVIRRAREKLPGCGLAQGYGLTETSPLLTTLDDADHAGGRMLSCGRPVIGVELAILDAEGGRAPNGAPGEIVARGANIMRGYWRQPEATRDAFVNGEVGGWFRTGDVAYQDEDGFVYHVDRRKDMIVSGGENVYSSEVEAAVYSHPCVKEAAVIGIPDPRWGELVMACVVLKDGAALTADDLIEHCRARIAGYKVPRRVEFLAGELPKSGTNKILKRKLREPYWKDAGRRVGCALAAFLLTSAAALAQNAPSIEAGQKVYTEHCAACHGTEAEGSDQGPKLGGNRRLRSRSAQQLRSFIYDGLPSSGMPSFHLPAPQLDSLVAFVRSLNSPAADSALPGVAAAGQQFFFGKGECAFCHMVGGRGKPIGPDLSSVARELTVSEIKQALLYPDARITPGYELVTTQLKDGRTLHGFARGRTNYDLQLQDLDGRFHLLGEGQIASLHEEKGSLMRPLKTSPEELRDLMAYLGSLTGVKEGPADAAVASQTSAGPQIDFARIQNPHPGDWLTYNGNLNGNRYSDLKLINQSNVDKLAVKWILPIDHFGLEVTPVVADGVMYVTGPNQALALDALTGRVIWKYARPRTAGLIGDASLGTNRGVAILGDKVFMAMDNAHLIALNRITGSLVWDVYMPEEPQHYGSTVAPLAVKDMIIAGVSGGDRGIRGFLAGYKASTGERIWRHFTVPLKGERGSETWQGKEPLFGGGATWLTGSYDPGTDTLYWPTGNPWPDSDDRDRPGDNLFTNCILAMHPETGEIKWHYQFTPHDVHDWDATEPPVLVDTQYRGQPRKLLLHADRNGFFYVLDRTDGKILLAKAFVKRMNWTTGIGPNGRPLPAPENPTSSDCPADAANWNSAAYSPVTRLYYVLAHEECHPRRGAGWKAAKGDDEPAQKVLRAIDIDTGNIAWEIPQVGPVIAKTWPGVMATAGGLVFYGDPNGAFAAVDERQGKTLWHFATNVYMKASPMTYMAGGRQFIAMVAGPNIMCFGLP